MSVDLPAKQVQRDFDRRKDIVCRLDRMHRETIRDRERAEWKRRWLELLRIPRAALGRTAIDAWLWVVILTVPVAFVTLVAWVTLFSHISTAAMLVVLTLACLCSATITSILLLYPANIDERILETINRARQLEVEQAGIEENLAILKPKLKQAEQQVSQLQRSQARPKTTEPPVFGTRCVADDGHKCGSKAERDVDNFLYARRIPHEREQPYPGGNGFTVDFVVNGVFIEYFGLSGKEEYDARIQEKRAICEDYGIDLIELYPDDLKYDTLDNIFRSAGLL